MVSDARDWDEITKTPSLASSQHRLMGTSSNTESKRVVQEWRPVYLYVTFIRQLCVFYDVGWAFLDERHWSSRKGHLHLKQLSNYTRRRAHYACQVGGHQCRTYTILYIDLNLHHSSQSQDDFYCGIEIRLIIKLVWLILQHTKSNDVETTYFEICNKYIRFTFIIWIN